MNCLDLNTFQTLADGVRQIFGVYEEKLQRKLTDMEERMIARSFLAGAGTVLAHCAYTVEPPSAEEMQDRGVRIKAFLEEFSAAQQAAEAEAISLN